MGIDIVHRNTAGYAGAEQAGRHAHGNQLGFQCGLVGRADRQIRFGGNAGRLLYVTVGYVGSHGRFFIYYTHAHVQRACNPSLTGGNGCAGIHVQVINPVLVTGCYLCISRIIDLRIGYHGKGRTFHPVGVHIIAGLESCRLSASRPCNGAGYVKSRHGLFRICSHAKVFGINGILFFGCIGSFITFFRVIPRGRRSRHAGRRNTVNFVGSPGKAGRNTS